MSSEPRISDHSVQQILHNTDLVELAASHTELRKRGVEYNGICPMCQGRDTIFFNRERAVFHCFACGQTGNTIQFVQAVDQVSFTKAARSLARRAGVVVEYED